MNDLFCRQTIRALELVFALGIALLQGGCLTIRHWHEVAQTYTVVDGVPGVLRETEKSPQQLIITGYIQSKDRRYFVLPLNEKGQPPSPFLYQGSERRSDFIVAEAMKSLPPETMLPEYNQPGVPVTRAEYKDFGKQGFGWGREMLKLGDPAFYAWVRADEPHVFAVMAFRQAADGSLQPVAGKVVDPDVRSQVPGFWDHHPGQILWPDDCIIVVIPQYPHRWPQDLARARAVATLSTPVLLLGDVAAVPMWIHFFIIRPLIR